MHLQICKIYVVGRNSFFLHWNGFKLFGSSMFGGACMMSIYIDVCCLHRHWLSRTTETVVLIRGLKDRNEILSRNTFVRRRDALEALEVLGCVM